MSDLQNDLQKLFVEAVSSEWLKNRIRLGEDSSHTEGELDGNIKTCLELMVTLEQSEGNIFDHQAYSQNVHNHVVASGDRDIVFGVFQEYCHFQVMISLIREFPELTGRFRAAGLDSWTRLRVDKRTLRPFAECVVRRLAETLMDTGSFSLNERVEAAEFLNQVTDLFEIPLSPELRPILEWLFDEQRLLANTDESLVVEEEEELLPRVLN